MPRTKYVYVCLEFRLLLIHVAASCTAVVRSRACGRLLLPSFRSAHLPVFVRSLPLKSARVSKSTDERAESNASIQSVLGGMKAARAEKDAARQLQAQATEARAAAKAAVATAARSLNPKSYGDAVYWEERHAKSRASGETFEWYTGYPDEALQKAFPQSVRGKKTLVIGCGTSVLSEKMCDDGFRDVLSIDTSKNAVEQMTARAKPFNNANTKCRYQVMDACELSQCDGETFGGVVDKGTIDAVLSGGLERARRICQEVMRVLEPGGKFFVISNTPGEKLLAPLLAMCGPGSTADQPLAVPVQGWKGGSDDTDDRVYAYTVLKRGGSGAASPRQAKNRGGNGAAAGAVEEGPASATGRGGGRRAPSSASDTGVVPSPEECRQEKPPSEGLGERDELLSREVEGLGTIDDILAREVKSLGQSEDLLARDKCLGKIRDLLSKKRPPAPKKSESGDERFSSPMERKAATRPPEAMPLPEATRPPKPALPWGSRESFSEDSASAIYELKLDKDVSPSTLPVSMDATRVKVSYRPPSGGGDPEVLLDREFHGHVTGESTWCIEDKRVLVLSLCKRTQDFWKRPFKKDESEPQAATTRSLAGDTSKTHEPPAVCDTPELKKSPAAAGLGPSKPVPTPPTVPRKHVRSPKVGLVASHHNFKAPERFLLEDHIGIKKLQLYLSKPPGFEVTKFQVSRVGVELCEVRFVCRDAAGRGLPDAQFLQRVDVGREDFDGDRASCSAEATESMCVVGVPYSGTASGRGVEEEAESDGLDDEGLQCVSCLRCRFCKHPITPAGRVLAVRAMPSGRWDECIEDMICYDGPQAVPMLARDVNFARPGRCLMAQAEVLLHPRDVIRGALTVADARGGAISMVPEEDDLEWRGVDCARCDLPLGRPATSPIGHDNSSPESVGLLLLKHCLLGDGDGDGGGGIGGGGGGQCGASDAKGGGDEQEAARGNGSGTGSATEGGLARGPLEMTAGSPEKKPLRVFENRTAIKWLQREMTHYNERDGCARFILSAKGRSPAAPGGSLSLLLVKMNSLVSVDGSSKPGRAHRVAFREESLEEAERAEEEERRGFASEASPPRDGAAEGGGLEKTAAKVPARLLEVSYGEYATVRQRLLGTAWAGAPWRKLDSRGYSYSYLF
ncbi:unnamed protein product [Ectocarpus sp. 4 AP-2014]